MSATVNDLANASKDAYDNTGNIGGQWTLVTI